MRWGRSCKDQGLSWRRAVASGGRFRSEERESSPCCWEPGKLPLGLLHAPALQRLQGCREYPISADARIWAGACAVIHYQLVSAGRAPRAASTHRDNYHVDGRGEGRSREGHTEQAGPDRMGTDSGGLPGLGCSCPALFRAVVESTISMMRWMVSPTLGRARGLCLLSPDSPQGYNHHRSGVAGPLMRRTGLDFLGS